MKLRNIRFIIFLKSELLSAGSDCSMAKKKKILFSCVNAL